jgi:Calcineurin-like phosphoesterase
MIERIERAPVEYPVRFVIAGDSGAWRDPTAEGIYAQLIRQVAALSPAPVFFANLGDFAGPGTLARHESYMRAMEELPMPNLCVVGNHDLDDAAGWEAFMQIHGPVNYQFAYGHTRFVAIHCEPGVVGQVEVPVPAEGMRGPRAEDLAFLEAALGAAHEPHRVVLMHMPPHLDGHFAPHADWGFKQREPEFLDLLERYGVTLVCCAHGLAFDTHVRNGIRFVMSGGAGTGICSDYRGVCTEGAAHPEDRGALFHVVEITISASGGATGRVIQAFDPDPTNARIRFGGEP